ncbi:hypothetical protein TRFO_22001 [Tritrichomonas foetus]|uniref:Uncharacterized protein n=1 Tax=Tritrichomonas foetus TaxID=1144522 RepID=A0A1J4KCM8_9EUKA|nr:hypothetical protein TRFO_22001 [Tritrichomonas foetus]|eukprot:OHT09183.1 hypothetical protein TRFO_22001 [Tritrichomonas foetus]
MGIFIEIFKCHVFSLSIYFVTFSEMFIKGKKNFPAHLWKLTKQDFILFIGSLIVQAAIFTTYYFRNIPNIALQYQDSIFSVAAAKYFGMSQEEKLNDGYYVSFLRSKLPFFQPLILPHAILLRGFSFVFFQSYKIAQYVSIVFTSLTFCYTFRRVLMMANLNQHFFISLVILVFPIGFAFLRNNATSDCLYGTFINLTFIFFSVEFFSPFSKENRKLSNLLNNFLFLVFLFLAAITRMEGFLLYPIFVLSLLLKKDVFTAIFVALVGYSHFFYLNNVENYNYSKIMKCVFHPHRYETKLVNYPFQHILVFFEKIDTLRNAHASFILYLPLLIGGISLLITQDTRSIGIFVLSYTFATSCFNSNCVYRLLAIPESYAFIVVMNLVLSELFSESSANGAKFALYVMFPIVLIYLCIYASEEVTKLNLNETVYKGFVFA